MKGQTRTFIPGTWEHIYKRSADGGLLFYSVRDRLVYFTIFALAAKRYHIEVMALCLMFDHIHEMLRARYSSDRKRFEQYCNSVFSREWNESAERNGPVFESYGSAPKKGEKYQRNCFAYIQNNGPERKLCRRAEDYQWNFLAYATSRHPFSEPVRRHHISRALEKSLDRVSSLHRCGRYLGYRVLESLSDGLNPIEIKQLTDHIISTYNVIDYQASISLYGDYETLLTAINSNTGAEHDIREKQVGVTDKDYLSMISLVHRAHPELSDIKRILTWDTDRRMELFQLIRKHTYATGAQIAKFLHLKLV